MQALDQLPDLILRCMAIERIPGAAAGLIVAGQTRFLAGFGTTRVDDHGAPVTPDTPFAVGSVTKPLIATALFATRTLDLDEPLPTPGRVTLRKLLSHTSGLDLRDTSSTAINDPLRQYELHPNARMPTYSNAAFALAAFFAERQTRCSIDALVDEHLGAPIGMLRTGFERAADTASAHDLDEDVLKPAEPAQDLPIYKTARGAYSTARDLLAFARAHLSGAFDPMHVTIAERRSRASSVGFGLGFETHEYKDVHLVGHAGHLGPYWSQLMMAPSRGLAFVLLCSRPPRFRLTSAPYRVVDVALDLDDGPVALGCPVCGADVFEPERSCAVCDLTCRPGGEGGD